jgi:rhamnosyltransferase
VSEDAIDVVVRCKNEMPHVERTLEALRRLPVRVLFVDSGSTDGSLERAERAGVKIVRIAPEAYVPGRVLNEAMRSTTSSIVAFVNADAIPLDDRAVGTLVDVCRSGAAAAYGRQVPRPDARAITRVDYARAFPADPAGAPFRHFFSMAASAIRREVWERLAFDDELRFSEDVDWTYRLRALGARVAYAPDARFEHSHDYDRAGLCRRMTGEGVANAAIFRLGPPHVWHDLLRPVAVQLGRDAVAGLRPWQSVALRWTAERARYAGRGRRVERRPRKEAPAGDTTARFTRGGDPRDEALVGAVVDATVAGVERVLGDRAVATLLLGSFACGEGAMEITGGARAIHNDLDFVVAVEGRRSARALRGRCHALGEDLSRQLGATVDVWPVATEELDEPGGRLLWLDASVRGLRLLRGEEEVVHGLRGLSARTVVGGEIGRLLANRATGLALSRLAFDAGAVEDETAARHVAKGWLAVGDALLLWLDQYAVTSQGRLAELQSVRAIGADFVGVVAEGYAWACRFRADPAGSVVSASGIASACAAMWPAVAALEALRIGVPAIPQPSDYAEGRFRVFDELPDMRPAARLLGGPRAAVRGAVGWRQAFRSPRESLARASMVLAFADDRAEARRTAARVLGVRSGERDCLRSALVRLRGIAA